METKGEQPNTDTEGCPGAPGGAKRRKGLTLLRWEGPRKQQVVEEDLRKPVWTEA